MQGLVQRKGYLSAFVLFVGFLFCLSMDASAQTSFSDRPEVKHFVDDLVKNDNFKRKQLLDWFDQVKIRKPILRSAARPLEKEPWHLYQTLFVTQAKIQEGVKFWKKYASILKKAEKVYGIPASVIIATLGIETKYGQKTGEYRVIDSLSNLGFSHSNRAPYFRRELREFFLMVREQHLNPLKIRGSYAGAIGMPQFMPSSYRHYATNFANRGTPDLMHNMTDVIASIANYYQKHGWKKDEPVAAKAVLLATNRLDHLLKYDIAQKRFTVAQLIRYGVYPKQKLTPVTQSVKLIALDNKQDKEYWMGCHNFNVIKRYNSSNLYAMAVYQLSGFIETTRKHAEND